MDVSVEPEVLAKELIDSADPDWIRHLVDALDRQVRTEPLRRLTTLWDLSNAAAARMFGVSRQAFSKWLSGGPPAERIDDVSTVDGITNMLDHYVRRERIPAVVRRSFEKAGGRSVIEMLEDGDYEAALHVIRDAFDLRRIQP